MSEYLEIEQNGSKAHVSVGAIIVNSNDEVLMLDRKNKPLGWAGPAGHMDMFDKSPEDALKRELLEEIGIDITPLIKFKIGEEFLPWNVCGSGVKGHYWHLYLIQMDDKYLDKIRLNAESKALRWVKRSELKKLKLEEAFEYWFKKLGWV